MSMIGAKIVPIPIDERFRFRNGSRFFSQPKLIFTTPSHQQPLGTTMSLRRRLGLLKYAADCGAWIIEDDYDSEFRYRGRPLPALSALIKTAKSSMSGPFRSRCALQFV